MQGFIPCKARTTRLQSSQPVGGQYRRNDRETPTVGVVNIAGMTPPSDQQGMINIIETDGQDGRNGWSTWIGISTWIVRADEPRLTTQFKSANGKFILQYHKKIWRLTNEKGKVLYKLKDRSYTTMTIFVSSDGMRLTIIDDFMEWRNPWQLPVLQFFNKGKLVNSYKLKDLVNDSCNLAHTIWHTLWSLDDYGFKSQDSLFSLATFEFNEMEFDTYTGAQVKNQKPAPFDENTSIVVGTFTKGDSALCHMKIRSFIAGKRPAGNEIDFTTYSFNKGNWTELLMIRDGVDATPDRFRARMHPDGCKL